MKTSEQILERYLSQDSVDFFSAQRRALLGMLPFEMAKPYLDPSFVKATEDGTLPEEEKWIEGHDINKQILAVIPSVYKALYAGDEVSVSEGLLYLNAWIWAIDEEFHSVIAPLYDTDVTDEGKALLDGIAEHFGYVPFIEDVDYEEVPGEPVQEEEVASSPIGEPYTSGTSRDESA